MEDHDIPRWAVQLEGDPLDLTEWEQALPDLCDYRVEKVPQGDKRVCALSGPSLNEVPDAKDVRARALAFVEQMNGLMWLVCRAQPVRAGDTVFRLGSDGSVGVHVFVEIGSTIRLGGLRPIVSVTQSDGSVVSSTPATDPIYRLALMEAESSDELADLLVQAGRAGNWFDLYKAIELAERLVGGERVLQEMLGDRGKAFKAARTTANFFRHARTHRPARLTTLGDARASLAEAVDIVLRKIL